VPQPESNEQSRKTLENLGHEDRSFPPDADFTAQANGRAELYAAAETDYDTDLEAALAALAWLRARDDIDAGRVGVAGHSAGALTACHVCRDAPDAPTAAIFLGALASPIDDMLRWNLGRMIRHWSEFTAERRAWLLENLPTHLVRAEGGERYLEAAGRGEPTVVLEGHGVTLELRTRRTFQDLHTSYEAEFRHVGCPALVLHGGEDLNVPVADALTAYRALRRAGNDDVTLTVLPGLDHYFHPVPPERLDRIWERVSLECHNRQMAAEALDAIAGWASRVLQP